MGELACLFSSSEAPAPRKPLSTSESPHQTVLTPRSLPPASASRWGSESQAAPPRVQAPRGPGSGGALKATAHGQGALPRTRHAYEVTALVGGDSLCQR